MKMCKWMTDFKYSHESQVHNMVMKNPRIKVSKIAKDIGISDERGFHILTVELEMKKALGKMSATHIDNGSKPPESENLSRESISF